MADVARPVWSGQGIIVNFIAIPEQSKLSQETFDKWYDEVHVPALIATGVVKSAWIWKAANPAYAKQHMSIFKVPDLSQVQAGKLQEVKRTSDMFPDGRSVDEFIGYESRTLSLVQLYETVKQPEDAATTIIMAAMQPPPGGEANLDAWYREEHNQQMSQQPGWKRTTRFENLFQWRNGAAANDAPSFFAIHEFGEGHKLGEDVKTLEPMTEWTRQCMAEMKAIDAAIYTKVKGFGAAVSS